MDYRILGPLEVRDDDRLVGLGGDKQRAVLAILLLYRNEVVSADRLIDELWNESPPASARRTVQAYVSRLRKALRSDSHSSGSNGDVLLTKGHGYLLRVGPAELDLERFSDIAERGRDALAAGRPQEAAGLLRDALRLWRGPPLADFAHESFAQTAIAQLEELRLGAIEERVEAELIVGRPRELVGELRDLVAHHPLRERLRGHLMLALYGAGRQAEALEVYQNFRRTLAEELGLDPGPRLQRLELAILTRDPALTLPTAAMAPDASELPRSSVGAMFDTRYAKSGGVHIAYQVLSGSEELDLVMIPPGVSNLEVFWEQPLVARFLRGLGSFSRMAIFDVRGSGMSDRSIGHPTIEERMDDARAVMDAVGMARAALVGYSHGGPMAMTFAATYPERTSALVLFGTFARLLSGPGFSLGYSRDEVARFLDLWAERWGTPDTLTLPWYCPSKLGDDRFLRWLNRFERQSATPADLRAMTALDCEIDVRAVLAAIRVPTLVIHRKGDRVNKVEQARWIATQIPGARYLELAGEDHFPYVGDQDAVIAAIEKFLTGRTADHLPDRVLVSVLFVRLVSPSGSTRDDARLSGELDARDGAYARELERFRGRRIRTTSGGLLAVFDGPARAIHCSRAILTAIRMLDVEACAGVHTGECERRGEHISGIPVDIAVRIAALAQPGEVLVSRTVSDLIAGSQIPLTDRGQHDLPGVSETWHLYAVSEVPAPA